MKRAGWLLCTLLCTWAPESARGQLGEHRLEIPGGEELQKLAEENTLPATGASRILLHYRPRTYGRLGSLLLGLDDTAPISVEQVEQEPYYFSKPSESVYKARIGAWGESLRQAVKDNEEAQRVMSSYQTNAILSTSLIVSGMISIGFMLSSFWFDPPESEEVSYRLAIGGGVGIGLLGLSVIPLYLNTGKIQEAVQLYNR